MFHYAFRVRCFAQITKGRASAGMEDRSQERCRAPRPRSVPFLIGAAGKWVWCLIKVKVKKAKSSTYVGKM
jgi:hypothetical protein